MTQDILDVLIGGGGPGGTAAAFRAQELGLSAQVIEYDDLMKRIRDYSKDKLILPSFGGGDQMRFPRGGPLIDCLCFDPIDKDEMCAAWKGHYRRHGVTRAPRRPGGRRERDPGGHLRSRARPLPSGLHGPGHRAGGGRDPLAASQEPVAHSNRLLALQLLPCPFEQLPDVPGFLLVRRLGDQLLEQ